MVVLLLLQMETLEALRLPSTACVRGVREVFGQIQYLLVPS